MQAIENYLSFQLKKTELQSFRCQQGSLFEVLQGLVWLTVEGDTEDYWLSAGETLRLPAMALVVIEAEIDICRCVLSPQADTPPTCLTLAANSVEYAIKRA